MSTENPENRDEFLDEMVEKFGDREMMARFGDPRDKNDPRNWTPTQRAEKGLSTEEQLQLLGLDMEMMVISMGKLLAWKLEQEKRQFMEEIKNNPEKALEKLLGSLGGMPKGAYGPLDNDNPDTPIRYAGSTGGGIAPDTLVETPDGVINASQIPGYVNDPNWKPSPDWVDANCMCPSHQEQRRQANGGDDSAPGMYL